MDLANPAVQVAIVGAAEPQPHRGERRRGELHLSEADLEQVDRIMAGSVAVAGPFPEAGPAEYRDETSSPKPT